MISTSWPGWNDANVEVARKMYVDDGMSAQTIAHRIGAPSRNAVIGKLNRMGIGRALPSKPKRGSVIETSGQKHPRTKRASPPPKVTPVGFKPPAPLREIVVDTSFAKPWLDRERGECQWVVEGEGADIIMCCAPAVVRWCPAHLGLGISPKNAKKGSVSDLSRSLRRYL